MRSINDFHIDEILAVDGVPKKEKERGIYDDPLIQMMLTNSEVQYGILDFTAGWRSGAGLATATKPRDEPESRYTSTQRWRRIRGAMND